MAVVGHAYVVVRAITDKVDQDITRAFSGSRITNSTERAGRQMGNALVRGLGKGVDGIDNKLTRVSRSFNDLYPEADGLRRSFVRLNRVGMILQSGLGGLGGSLAALVGGVGALLGPLAGLASGLVAVGSAAISARIGIGVAQYALGGISEAVKNATKQTTGYGMSVEELREALQQLKFDQEDAALSVDRAGLNLEKARQNMMRTADLAPNSLIRRDAELAFREAELAYRRAKDRQEDLKEGLKTPGGGGATDPFADLTPSQRAFAEYLLTIQDIFKDLREAAAAGFLPLLQTQIERLINSGLLEILEARFYDIGVGAGQAVEEFNDVFLSGDNFRDFNEVLKNTADILPSFGRVLGNSFSILLSLLETADPLTRRFVEFLDSKTGSFSRLLDVRQARGELEDFFDRAGDIGADFGAFFGGIFGGFGKIIEANFGPGSGGDMFLQWLVEVGDGFRNKDLIGLDKYFKGAVDNLIIMSQTLGGAIETIVRAGSDPAVRTFWETLDRGSFAFDKLVRNFVESGPGFANLLRSLTEVLAILSDAGPVQAFTNTLAAAFDGLARFLERIEPLIKVLGPIFGIITAITLLASLLSKAILVLGSFLALIAKGIGVMAGFSSATIGTTIATVGATNALRAFAAILMATPIGWITAAVAAVVGLGMAMDSIDASNADKAVSQITNALKSGEGSLLEASELAAYGLEKAVYGIDDVKDAVKVLEKTQGMRNWSNGIINVAMPSTRIFQKQLDSLSTSLANIAVTDLEDAQDGFKRLRREMSALSDREMKSVLSEMGDFRTALVDQAQQLDINIYNLDGTIDETKLLAFAMGEGEYALRKHISALEIADEKTAALRLEQIQLQQEFQRAAIEAGGFSDSLRDAFEEIEIEGEKSTLFNPQKALENMRESIQTTVDYNKNLFALQGRGLSATSLEFIREQGALGPQIAAALLDESDSYLSEFNSGTEAALVQSSDQFATYLVELQKLASDNTITPSLIKKMQDDLLEATTQEELDKVGGWIAARIGEAVTEATRKDPMLLYFKGEMTAMEALKQSGFGNNVAGFIRNIDRFASGGFVVGPGGPRTDSIPAMLSNGEYVVNARSTSRYKNILERINAEGRGYADGGMVSGSPLGGNVNIVVNASPGMDTNELASEVERRLAFKLVRGRISI